MTALPVLSRYAWHAPAATALAILLLASSYVLPLLAVAANRLALGVPAYGSEAIGASAHLVAGLGAAGLLLLAGTGGRWRAALALAALGAALVALALGFGEGAQDLVTGKPAATRVSLASGAWIGMLVLGTTIVWAVRRTKLGGLGIAVLVVLGVALVLAGRLGWFDHLSLAVELRARRSLVAEAILQHLVLAGGALALAVVLAVAVSLWRQGQGLVEMLVSGIQVVPAVALLGALVALVSALLKAVPSLREAGFSALGAGPALVGIAAYLLLPLWRGLAAGLGGTDAAILDAATAIGLSRTQILLTVRLPLGAPVLIGALRVAAVQSLGLATLGALVGAGGLGRIVFDGMAQFAPDLILLGALPIIALSLGAETVLSAAEARVRTRWGA